MLSKTLLQNVELVNADFKEHRKLRRFSGRGLLRVGCEVGLTVLAHNLPCVMNGDKSRPSKSTENQAPS